MYSENILRKKNLDVGNIILIVELLKGATKVEVLGQTRREPKENQH